MPPIGVISICLQSSPPVGLTPGTLASPGGAKVLLIGGLQTPDRPQSYPYRAAHQAGRPSRGAATICLICMPARASRADSSRAELAIWPVQRRKPIAEPILVCCVRAHETLTVTLCNREMLDSSLSVISMIACPWGQTRSSQMTGPGWWSSGTAPADHSHDLLIRGTQKLTELP